MLQEQLWKTNTALPLLKEDVKVITDIDGSIYYNMLIERAVKENLKFENLVIKVKDTVLNALILKYTLSEKATYSEEHDSYAMDVNDTEMTPLPIDGKQTMGGVTCVMTNIFMCSALGGDFTENHVAQPICYKHTGIYLTSQLVCSSSGNSGGSGTSGWTPNTNDGPGTHGGGFGNTGSPIITAPIVDDENVLAGSTPCDKLFDLVKPNISSSNPFRAALLANKASVNETQNPKEKGQRLKISPVTLQLSVEEINNTSIDCNSIPIVVTNFMFGFFHSHPKNCGTYFGINPLFSAEDIHKFYLIVANHNGGSSTYQNGTPVDINNFVITVAGEYGTFALKINDRNAFINVFSSLNADEKFDLFEDFNRKMARGDFNNLGVPEYSYTKKTQKMLELLQSKFGNSLSLYQANDDLTSWEKLKLNTNNSGIPIKITCP